MRTKPDAVTVVTIGGRKICRDEAGYLVDPEDWNETIAAHFAAEENISLNREHLAIVEFMRNYLQEHGVAADARFVFRFLANCHNQSQSDARNRFFTLFPYGYVKQACKIAGMRQPRAWSTG